MSIYIGSRYESGTVAFVPNVFGTNTATVFRGESPYVSDQIGLYLTSEGDRIDRLARRFYGDENLWWVIADANGTLPDPIPAGTVLRIPDGRDIR